jgi:cell division septation protein DedD
VNTLYSRGNDMEDDPEFDDRNNREISIGTSFIVGIFFALVLICAIFFAFGYSLGRRSVLPASGVAAPVSSSSTVKPASGVPETQGPQSSADTTDNETSAAADDSSASAPAAETVKPASVSKPAAQSTATMPGAVGSVVQVAAVSRQGDANMLMAALKRKGYSAAIHQVPQDKLLHVQIGPFATKKEAEAMRQKLISDGYNAIVK